MTFIHNDYRPAHKLRLMSGGFLVTELKNSTAGFVIRWYWIVVFVLILNCFSFSIYRNHKNSWAHWFDDSVATQFVLKTVSGLGLVWLALGLVWIELAWLEHYPMITYYTMTWAVLSIVVLIFCYNQEVKIAPVPRGISLLWSRSLYNQWRHVFLFIAIFLVIFNT